jgi:hypothetical protein
VQSDVKQIEVHTVEPLVPGHSRFEAQIAIEKLKKYKSPGSDQIPAELIQAGGEMLLSAIHKLITSIWNKEELPDQWKESIIVPIHEKGDKTDCNNYHGISLLSTSYKINKAIVGPSTQHLIFSSSDVIATIYFDHMIIIRRQTVVYNRKRFA